MDGQLGPAPGARAVWVLKTPAANFPCCVGIRIHQQRVPLVVRGDLRDCVAHSPAVWSTYLRPIPFAVEEGEVGTYMPPGRASGVKADRVPGTLPKLGRATLRLVRTSHR